MSRIVALVEDLMLGSKVQALLEGAGQEVALTGREDEARAEIEFADVLVVDLGADGFDGVTLVDSMATGGELHGKRTLGLYSHVDVDTRRRAEAAGFDLVVPRSRFMREGADLVARLTA